MRAYSVHKKQGQTTHVIVAFLSFLPRQLSIVAFLSFPTQTHSSFWPFSLQGWLFERVEDVRIVEKRTLFFKRGISSACPAQHGVTLVIHQSHAGQIAGPIKFHEPTRLGWVKTGLCRPGPAQFSSLAVPRRHVPVCIPSYTGATLGVVGPSGPIIQVPKTQLTDYFIHLVLCKD